MVKFCKSEDQGTNQEIFIKCLYTYKILLEETEKSSMLQTLTKMFMVLYLVMAWANCTLEGDIDFASYCFHFNKRYQEKEYGDRERQFYQRVNSFASITSFHPAINNYTDWYPSELAKLRTLKQLPQSQREQFQDDSPHQKVGAASSLDWRSKNVVTMPKNQGSCGSCWSFAAAAAAESKLIKDGKYSQWGIDLSEQYLLECTTGSSCNGGYLEYAMKQARQTPKESKYPYSPYYSYSGICRSSGIEVASEVKNYYGLSNGELINLLQDGPVAISISSEGWESYGSGIFSCNYNDRVDHAVLLVGYTSSYWIVKNSWGTSWGLNGYIYVDRSYSANCRIGTSAHVFIWEGFLSAIISMALLSILIL